MEYVIGIAAAAAGGLFATVIGFDKERSFYPVVLIVIATIYLLFAAMAKSTGSLVAEAIPALVFVALAALGFRKTPWLVVAGLALHGVFDFFHHAVIANAGVPVWWPGWCLAYDVVAAAYLAALLFIRRTSHAAYLFGGPNGGGRHCHANSSADAYEVSPHNPCLSGG